MYFFFFFFFFFLKKHFINKNQFIYKIIGKEKY